MKWGILGNIGMLLLAGGAVWGILCLLLRRRRKRTLIKWAAVVLVCYLLCGIFVSYLRHPEVSQTYQDSWDGGAFYGPASGRERVALVRSNQAALEERLRMIGRAKERIILSTFDFIPDNSGLDVIAMLYEAAQRGVQVEVVVDGFNALLKMDGEPHFQTLAAHPNVEIYIYNPVNILRPWTLMGRLHDKYIIVDDELLLLGGRNTNDYFLGQYPASAYSLDMEVLVWGGGEGMGQVESYFREILALDCTKPYRGQRFHQAVEQELAARAAALREAYPQCFGDYDYRANTYPANKITLLHNPIHTGAKEPTLFWSMVQLMKDAEQQVLLHTPYVICNEAMYDGLGQVAAQVPEAHLVLNAPETAANLFGTAVYCNERQAILDTGFQVYAYYCQQENTSSHMKAVLIDSRLCLIGSFNLDMRSAYLDTELVLAVDSPELAAELGEYMVDMEASSGHVIRKDQVDVPDGVFVPEMTFGKSAVLTLLRLVERPFRFLM